MAEVPDELGNKAVKDVYHVRDIHATVLHRWASTTCALTYHHTGRNRRLTDTGGRLIKEVVA